MIRLVAIAILLTACTRYPAGAVEAHEVQGGARAASIAAEEWEAAFDVEPCLDRPRVEMVSRAQWQERTCPVSEPTCTPPGSHTIEYWRDPPLVLVREGAPNVPGAIAHEWLHALEMRCLPPRAWWVYQCHGADPRTHPDHECTSDRSGWRGPTWGDGGVLERVEAQTQ